jgi:Golgi nucleoside diphosphatase
MNQPSLTALKAAIYEMGLYFNQQPSDDRITAYAKALANYSDKQVIFAFKQVINSGTAFFPSLAEILKHLKPQEETHDKAPQIAAEMLKLIRWYGKHDEENMLKNASPEARETFLRLGDTQDIRNSENTDTVRAQLERLARSVMQSKQVEVKNKQLENIGIVLPLKRPDFSGYLPGGDIA